MTWSEFTILRYWPGRNACPTGVGYNETVIHRRVLFNDQIHDSTEKLLAPGQVGLLAGWGVFSTIRVADGVLFAFERHWARICRDATLFHIPMPCTPEEGRRRLLDLVEANGAHNATMRVVVVRNDGS